MTIAQLICLYSILIHYTMSLNTYYIGDFLLFKRLFNHNDLQMSQINEELSLRHQRSCGDLL